MSTKQDSFKFGVTNTYKGSDYTADFRVASGLLLGGSYFQSITERWSAGGEGFYSHPNTVANVSKPQVALNGARCVPLHAAWFRHCFTALTTQSP